MQLILVGCGARKLAYPAPAQDLYTGALFRAARAYAEAHAAAWYILSAQYGLVPPDQVIAPYDVYLPRLTTAERAAWGAQVAAQLAALALPDTVRWTLLAGRAYCDRVRRGLSGPVSAPLAGLGIGQRIAWLRAHR